jgi:hypothetical protein
MDSKIRGSFLGGAREFPLFQKVLDGLRGLCSHQVGEDRVFFSHWVKRQGREVDYIYLVLMLKITGVIPLLPPPPMPSWHGQV